MTGLTGTTDDHLKGYDSNGIPSEAPDFNNYQLNVDTNTTTLQRLNSPEFVYRKQKTKKKKSPPPIKDKETTPRRDPKFLLDRAESHNKMTQSINGKPIIREEIFFKKQRSLAI